MLALRWLGFIFALPQPFFQLKMTLTTIKNISSWRLNAAEKAELERRTAAGESEALVKKELQTKKAMANEERKRSAQAVSQRAQKQEQVAKSRAKAKAGPKAAAAAPAVAVDQGLEDATNKGYYLEVQADIQTVLQEFGGQAFCEALPLQIGSDASQSGVQEPFNRSKALQALAAHGTYRCSINITWVSGLQSATPGIPMARKRTEDLTDFYFGDGTPHFHAERMFECAVMRSDLDCDRPGNLRLISPEEMLHATYAGCARAIRRLGRRKFLSLRSFLHFFLGGDPL